MRNIHSIPSIFSKTRAYHTNIVPKELRLNGEVMLTIAGMYVQLSLFPCREVNFSTEELFYLGQFFF